MWFRTTRRFSSLFTILLGDMFLISFGFVLTQLGGGVASGRQFEIGTVYEYDYVVGVELNEPVALANYSYNWHLHPKDSGYRTGSTVGYKVLSQVQVTPVWQSEHHGAILEIHLIAPHLQIKSRKAPAPEGFHDHKSELDQVTLQPLYVHWKEGTVFKTFSVDNDDISLMNLKKGIANLLQFKTGKSQVLEETPRGHCNVTYDNKDSSHLSKTIDSECLLDSDSKKELFSKTSHMSSVLGSTTQSTVKVELKLTANSFVEEAQVTEQHTMRVNAKKEVGATVTATQEFKLTSSSPANTQMVKATTVDGAIEEIGKAKSISLNGDTLVPHPEKISLCEVTNCKAMDELFAVLTSENMATSKLANAFAQLVEKFRYSTSDEIGKILEEQKEILPQLLDVCAATGTKEAHDAVTKLLDFNNAEGIANSERYFLGLSLTTFPAPEIVDDLFTRIKTGHKNEKLQETLILSTAALVHTVRSQRKAPFGEDFEAFLLSSFEKCPVEKPKCSQLYLRALKNLKSKSTVAKLFEIVQNSDSKIGVVAMKALHTLPKEYIDPALYRSTLIRIINQLGKKYDSSTRTLAIDIFLRDAPTKEEIRQLLVLQLKSPNPLHAEVGTFLWNRLHEFMNTNPSLQAHVTEIVEEEGLRTYHHLSPRGLSTSFSRTFTSNPSGNSSFSNAIEMTGKILKRSSFDVYLHSEDNFIHPLSIGIFAGGLSSFATSDNGDNAVEDEEQEEATAGMELSVMGVQTRPIIFFVGKGELMGLVWSGAGSDKTTALQGNILLQNERAMIPLFNGLVADLNIQGALSFDLSGQITVSLWHRTANSLVQSRAGIVLQSVLRVDTSFVRSRVDYTVGSEATLDFTSDINFYDGVLMCLKLTQPEFNIKQSIHKTERIPGSKHRLRKAKYNTVPIPGVTYALNKKNSELCGIMHKDEL